MDKKISIDNMIALCNIIDEFDEFEKKLISAISSKYNRDLVFQIWDISQGKFKLGALKAKKFYEENKLIIDVINRYSDVPMFINQNYGWDGKPTGDLRFFYEYLVKYKEEMPKILEVLKKIKELGFKNFEFNEELDFTKEIYGTSLPLNNYVDLIYVANPQVIPNYASYINYITTDSNYKIKLKLSNDNQILDNGKNIVLNSLFFDPNTLPQKIDIEHTHEQLVKLKKEQQNNINFIKTSVKLGVSVLDLERQFNCSYETIINILDGVKNKAELIDILANMKDNLDKLKKISADYDSSVSQNEPLLTAELLEEEKRLYLRRREWSKID